MQLFYGLQHTQDKSNGFSSCDHSSIYCRSRCTVLPNLSRLLDQLLGSSTSAPLRLMTAYAMKKSLLLLLLLNSCSPSCSGTGTGSSSDDEPDVRCLKSFLRSVVDPGGELTSSWNFDNATKGYICGFTGVTCWSADQNRVLSLRLQGPFPRGLRDCASMTGRRPRPVEQQFRRTGPGGHLAAAPVHNVP